jgi:peptidoglycan-N-acetylglucosamine deacetylase
MIYFTSSWDDGSEYDIKLSELLLKYKQKGTFFIPLANIERQEVLKSKDIIEISKSFEIGCHTLNHKYLTRISNEEAEYEIKQAKIELESIICNPIFGFCLPDGRYRSIHIQYAVEAGFKYIRTNNMFKLKYYPNMMDTTLQAYNHSKFGYFKHIIKRGYYTELFQNIIFIVLHNHWDKLMFEILDNCIKNDSVQKNTIVHLWGHSWEIQENDMWHQLEQFLAHLSDYRILSMTNYEITKLPKKLND